MQNSIRISTEHLWIFVLRSVYIFVSKKSLKLSSYFSNRYKFQMIHFVPQFTYFSKKFRMKMTLYCIYIFLKESRNPKNLKFDKIGF